MNSHFQVLIVLYCRQKEGLVNHDGSYGSLWGKVDKGLFVESVDGYGDYLDGKLEVMHASVLKRRLLDPIFQQASQNAVETA